METIYIMAFTLNCCPLINEVSILVINTQLSTIDCFALCILLCNKYTLISQCLALILCVVAVDSDLNICEVNISVRCCFFMQCIGMTFSQTIDMMCCLIRSPSINDLAISIICDSDLCAFNFFAASINLGQIICLICHGDSLHSLIILNSERNICCSQYISFRCNSLMHDVIAICQTFYIVRLICRNPCQIGAICLLDLIALGIKDCDSCARQFFTRDICLGELCLCGVVFDVVMSSKLCCLTVIFRLFKRYIPCLIGKDNTIRYCCFLQRVLTQRNIFQCEAAILVDIESAALSIGVCMNTEAVSSGTGCQHLGNITLLCDYTSISRIFDVFCCIQSELDAGQIITVNERIVNSIRLCLNGLAECQLARCTVIGNCFCDKVIIIKLHSLCSRDPACCMIPP